jgi:glycosyltransferase involved in cell wall biosynthesis
MRLLANRAILLIAPQPWNHLQISKHCYAIELARRGNTVYFLEPPAAGLGRRMSVNQVGDNPGISVISYQLWFPMLLRFHARPLFDWLMRRQIRRILNAIGRPIDVVWCFEFNLFPDLRIFGAPLRVFHPVDPLSAPHQVRVGRSASAIFSVSEDILANFRDIEVPAWFINHGLSRSFAEVARSSLGLTTRTGDVIRVGYSGNLTRPPLNRAVLEQMITENPSVEFHFWGPTEVPQSYPPDIGNEIRRFTSFLDCAPNVQLHGSVSPEELANQLQQMDCLVLSYSIDHRESDRSNSHKILEYLSTGKVIVSSRLSTYVPRAGLLRMPDDGDDSQLPALMRDTLARLEEFNAVNRQDERRMFALDNTYERQLDRIEAKLSEVARLDVPSNADTRFNRRESTVPEAQPQVNAG